MRTGFEFNVYRIAAADVPHGVDATLALMGAQGWEMRGLAYAADGSMTIGLQRPLDEVLPLPDAPTLAATLEAPLAAPNEDELDALPHPAEAAAAG